MGELVNETFETKIQNESPYILNEDLEVIKSFDGFNLKNDLLKGIYSYGYVLPSPIQEIAIKPMIEKRDIIAQSQSGTGKTATFIIGMLQNIDITKNNTQSIIISHTRELAIQTYNVLKIISNYMKDISYSLCIGGSRKNKFINKTDNSHIIVGTPGRLCDLIGKKIINTSNINIVIIDEADEVLSLSFQDQVKEVMNNINKEAQLCLFSATLPDELFELIDNLTVNPVKILLNEDNITLDGIKQYYINVQRDNWKYDTLVDLYSCISIGQSIIYINNKNKADWLVEQLTENNFSPATIHSSMNQQERQNIMERFRAGDIRVLIATDVIARGIDVQQVSVVINYDMPKETETYIHRIGRSGRFGRKGLAINLITNKQMGMIKYLENMYNTNIDCLPNNIKQLIEDDLE
jgi:superfamily II DNA/RNA helicase